MQRDDYRATLIVMFGLAAATLTGFLRQAATADQLGAGRAADIYVIAFGANEIAVIVDDTTPPVIHSVTADPATLWPPNHKMVDVVVTVDATDPVARFHW